MKNLSRRELLKKGLVAAFAGLTPALLRGESSDPIAEAMHLSHEAHLRLASYPGLKMSGTESVGMLLYPSFTALDIVGPHYFFACMMGATVHLITTEDNLEPVSSDLALAIQPTITLKDAPAEMDVLFVPGGTSGTLDQMERTATLDFLRSRAESARIISSVCTGALLLGAAGLLQGKQATSHWVAHDLLAEFGATPVHQRVVQDGKLFTGAGVSAGLDLGLAIVMHLRGRPYAEALALQAEYVPEPPVQTGTPEAIDPQLGQLMKDMFAPVPARAKAIADRLVHIGRH